MVLEISVMMAQFPSKEIAELSYKYRTLGLGYANIGGLLMTSGIPYDFRRPRDLRCADRDHDRRCLRHLGRDGRRARPLPGLQENAKNMLRVMRNHRRAAHGEADGYEGLSVNPVPLDHANCPDPRPGRARHRRPGTRRWSSARSTATATRRPP
jgi:ribonucleoside-diphosphate reductase alpha chain